VLSEEVRSTFSSAAGVIDLNLSKTPGTKRSTMKTTTTEARIIDIAAVRENLRVRMYSPNTGMQINKLMMPSFELHKKMVATKMIIKK
jgi:hypothetical protein